MNNVQKCNICSRYSATECYEIIVDGHIFIRSKNVYEGDILHRETMAEGLKLFDYRLHFTVMVTIV
jgi:hypothetical protein